MTAMFMNIKIETFFHNKIYIILNMEEMKEEKQKMDTFYIQQLKEIISGTYKQTGINKEFMVDIEKLPLFKNKIKFAQEEQKKIDDYHIQQLKEIIREKYKAKQIEKKPMIIELKNLSENRTKITWATPLVTVIYYEK